MFKLSAKYTILSSVAACTGGLLYLQYANSYLGPISFDKEYALKYYQEQHKMSESDATKTYYYVKYSIAMARISMFYTYQRQCQQLRDKVLKHTVENYQQDGFYDKIVEAERDCKENHNKKATSKSKALYPEVEVIRKKNLENLALREYLVKGLREGQKAMDSNCIVGLLDSEKELLDTVERYLIRNGRALNKPDITGYVRQVQGMEHRYPDDYLARVLFI